MGENKIKIKFELTDEDDNNFIGESMLSVPYSCRETIQDIMGKQLNVFLRQCGYVRHNDLIFMEDITEEEYDALADYLQEFRNRKDCNNES